MGTFKIIKPIKRGGDFRFSCSLVKRTNSAVPRFHNCQSKELIDNTGGITQGEREEYLFNKFVKNSAFICRCDENRLARVYFQGSELFQIPESCCEVIDTLPTEAEWGGVTDDNFSKFNKHLHLKLTLKMCSEVARTGVENHFYNRDGRSRGLRYKEILYINALVLGWHIPSSHSEFGAVIRERCKSSWIYHNIIDVYHLSIDSQMNGNIIESDLLSVELRANMFYITEQGNKIGYWRLNKVLSQIILLDRLKDYTFTEIYNGQTNFLFEEETRAKYALKCKASVMMYKTFTENFVINNIDCREMELFYHAFCLKDEAGEFSIVSGVGIRDWYNEDNYYEVENGSSLSESCMRYGECYDYFSVYTQNKQVCQMLIYKHKSDGRIMGRALLWKATDGTKTYDVMDRIYYCYERILPQFTKWAVENNYVRKKRQSYECWTFINPDGTQIDNFRNVYIELDKYDFDYYPYCDTFYILDMENGRLCQENDGFEARHLRCTGGGYEDDGEYVYLDYCETRVHVDEACWSDYHDCYIHPDDCFHSDYDNSYIFCDEGTYCEDIEQDIHRDNATYSDRDDCYYTSDGTVYSELYDSDICADNAVKCVGGDNAYVDDCECIDGEYYIIDSDEHEQILIEIEACDKLYSTDTIIKEVDNTIDKSIELLTKTNTNEK